jgi:hypothetical protein
VTIDEAFSTFNWAEFHACGHPMQRFDGVHAPCSYCWNRGTNVIHLPAVPPPMHLWDETPVSAGMEPFRENILRLKAYVARDKEAGCKGVGRIWVLEG